MERVCVYIAYCKKTSKIASHTGERRLYSKWCELANAHLNSPLISLSLPFMRIIYIHPNDISMPPLYSCIVIFVRINRMEPSLPLFDPNAFFESENTIH